MAEGARLESVYTATYRGFESPPHRHIQKKSSYESTGFFFAYCTRCGGMRTHDRGSTTGGSQLDRPRTQRAGCPQGERSESIPPSPPYSRKSSYESTGFFFTYCTYCGGMRTHDRGSTTGGSQLDRPRTQRAGCPQGEQSESIPPHRHIQKKSSYESTGFFFAYCTCYPADKSTPGPVSVSATGRLHIAGWQRKRLIRPTKTSQDRYALAPSVRSHIAGWQRKRLIRPTKTSQDR